MGTMLYSRADLPVEALLSEIETGSTGLPDLQRPFVWTDSKVRDLFNSMLKGYPIGFVITWQSPNSTKSKQIGEINHGYSTPNKLIIDGQQRLTSLFSVIKGIQIVDSNFKPKNIVLAFNPFSCICEVSTAALANSADWIPDISKAFQSNSYTLTNEFVSKLNESRKKKGEAEVSDKEAEQISDGINALLNLKKYVIPTLDITSEADEEDVANIFVSINSGGTKLNQSDFILTLISVHWNEGRKLIEEFCQDTKHHNSQGRKDICNPIIDFDPQDVVRTVMAFGFKRARLKYAYKLLHGADFDKKGAISEELRNHRFDEFKDHLAKALDRNNFCEFLKCIESAGFVTKGLISSKTNIIYAYAFYLIGKYDFNISESDLRTIITKMIFFFGLSSRYVGSFESSMEQDMANIPEEKTTNAFKNYFDSMSKNVLTEDFFNITLIGLEGLETTNSKSPAFLAYIATQNILEAHVLFSKTSLSTRTLYQEWTRGARKAVELHHLYPKAYLKNVLGLKQKQINQVANYAFIEWSDNMDISDEAPSSYFPKLTAGRSMDDIQKAESEHALPLDWENMNYEDFLSARRKNMAKIIRKGYEKLNFWDK